MAIGDPHTSIITLNVNGLNSPIKRPTAADQIKKQTNTTICCLQETLKGRLNVKMQETILQANNIHKKASVDFKITKVTTEKDGLS